MKHIYRAMARKTWGDVYMSMGLTVAYQQRMLDIREVELHEARTTEKLLSFNETDRSNLFFRVFDNMCRRQLFYYVTHLTDTNQPLIPVETFDAFVEMAEKCFPRLWSHLCNLRDTKGNLGKKRKSNVRPKRRQVLLQFLLLKRMRNFRALKWWSLVTGIGFFGWGVGKSVLSATG